MKHHLVAALTLTLTCAGPLHAQSPTLVLDITPGPVGSVIARATDVAGTLFFLVRAPSGDSLWRTQGAAANTELLATFPTPSGIVGPLAVLGGQLLFRAHDAVNGSELWTSDGTVAGTHILKDIWAGTGSSSPTDFVASGAYVFFVAADNAHRRELWRTDGTEVGTVLVKDIAPGNVASNPRALRSLGDEIVFLVDHLTLFHIDLWRSDGTADGTERIAFVTQNFTMQPPNEFVVNGGRMFFSVDEPNAGRELWVTDGTTLGTQRVIDLLPGFNSAEPVRITPFADGVAFSATDGVNSGLWKSDGTPAGTQFVAPITPIEMRAANGGRLLFSANGGAEGLELWSSDGTLGGTHLLFDLVTGPFDGNPRVLTPIGERFAYFFANGGDSTATGFIPNEWWLTDGTAAGTAMFDVNPGAPFSLPTSPIFDSTAFAVSGGRLFAPLDDGVHGIELHVCEPGAVRQSLGLACASVNGPVELTSDDPVLGSTVEVRGSGATAGGAVVLLASALAAPLAIEPGCFAYLDLASLQIVNLSIAAATDWSIDVKLPPAPQLVGARVALQAAHLPGSTVLGLDITNGLLWVLGS